MAIGALERFGADVAVSITGIAGPGGGTEEKPVGYVCFNARLADGTALAREPVIPGGRADIRERSALVGMHMLRILLSGAEPPQVFSCPGSNKRSHQQFTRGMSTKNGFDRR